MTCESSDCPHLDPAIQASCFCQRISPAHMDQGPVGTQDAVQTVARSVHPMASTPKGSQGRSGRQSRLLSLGGTLSDGNVTDARLQRELPVCWPMSEILPCLVFALSPC